MKNRFSIIVLAGILALSSLACGINGLNININTQTIHGSGTLESETRSVSGIDAISLSAIGNLTIEYGEKEELTIEAEDNLLPYITSEVRNGELVLGTKENVNFNPSKPIRYQLVVTQPLKALKVSGLGDIAAPALTSANLDIKVSGSGNVELADLTTDELNVRISGLGSVFINEGSAAVQDIEISGSGQFEAEDMQTQETRIHISGLGSAKVWVTEKLTVDISGSGNIEYYGSPEIRQDISGIGKLHSQGEH